MSLIDEALKRARDEAARQEEAFRREKRPWVPPPPKRDSARPGIAALAGLVVLGMLAGAAWFALRRPAAPTTTAAPRSSPARAIARPEPHSPPPVLETVEVPPPAGTAKKGPEAPPPGPAPSVVPPVAAPPAAARPAHASARAPQTAPSVGTPLTEPSIGAPQTAPFIRAPQTAPSIGAPQTARPAPAVSSAAAPLRDGKTFVRVAPLPSGEKIELEGIVYSDTNPVAVIGGRVLSPGAYVGDFQIVRIEEGRVTLRGRGITFFVTLS